ncbi:hypothetical protein GCM10009592_00570 [Brachybacterium rhamnosum]|uniref:FmdB family zinc ribbon protein n=1 Tax=Brachybacterium rhamnosum TaxID=173361 RepID=A0ABW4PVN5_9MICO
MPTYVYACKNCGHRFEKYQSFSEDSLVTCPECAQDALRKVFDSVGVVFKGSGFYSTDAKSAGASTGPASSSESSGASSTPAPSTPAPSTAASSSSSSSSSQAASS